MTPHWTDALVRLDACQEAVVWARGYDKFEGAWQACPRGDWLLWLSGRLCTQESAEHRQVVRGGLACARTAWPFVRAHDRAVVQACYDATEGWVNGTVDQATLRRAAAAAAAASDAAAARATVNAAHAAYAAHAAVAATYAANYALYAALAADAEAHAATAARIQTLAACADLVRAEIDVAWVTAALEA